MSTHHPRGHADGATAPRFIRSAVTAGAVPEPASPLDHRALGWAFASTSIYEQVVLKTLLPAESGPRAMAATHEICCVASFNGDIAGGEYFIGGEWLRRLCCGRTCGIACDAMRPDRDPSVVILEAAAVRPGREHNMPTRHRRDFAGGRSFARPGELGAAAVTGTRSGVTQARAIERKPDAAQIVDRIGHESCMLNRSRSRDCRINDRRDAVALRTSV